MKRLRFLLIAMLLMSTGIAFARTACPAFKLGTYGSMELWYATYCDGPTFTTIVLPGGSSPASCPGPNGCISGLGDTTNGPHFSDKLISTGFTPKPDDKLVSRVTTINEEYFYVSFIDENEKPVYALVTRLKYPYPSKISSDYFPDSGLRTVYAFQLAEKPAVEAIEATVTKPADRDNRVTQILFSIDESEQIQTWVLRAAPNEDFAK